jgi:hypothetical protein
LRAESMRLAFFSGALVLARGLRNPIPFNL